MMSPEMLAEVHAVCFTTPRSWSASEFAELLHNPRVFLLAESGGFLLGRVIADEAEILTLAVIPERRHAGIGQRLVDQFLTMARDQGATRAFLEVSAENHDAARLYARAGFAAEGLRRGYFRDPNGQAIDALVLCCNLEPRPRPIQSPFS
jgi:[ribosomal protein S18]-alanine N-acetyltransferase